MVIENGDLCSSSNIGHEANKASGEPCPNLPKSQQGNFDLQQTQLKYHVKQLMNQAGMPITARPWMKLELCDCLRFPNLHRHSRLVLHIMQWSS